MSARRLAEQIAGASPSSTPAPSSATAPGSPRELEGGAELCAVVKADGYGHGAAECAAAALAGGASRLAVATAAEAAALRADPARRPAADHGRAQRGRARPGARRRLRRRRLGRRASSTPSAARGEALGLRPGVHVKYDTGMGRLGERDPRVVAELLAAAAADARVELAGLWTHFATADEPGSAFFDEQLRRFTELAEAARGRPPRMLVHAANSAATLRDPAAHFDMVRCGIAIYGLDPFQERPVRARPRAGARAALLRRRREALRARRQRRLRPDLAGAAARAGSGRCRSATATASGGRSPTTARSLVGGRRYPIVGTVSMDNITIDLGRADRRRARRRRRPDRGPGRRADPLRGGGAAPRDDQLRGHRPASRRGCRGSTSARERRDRRSPRRVARRGRGGRGARRRATASGSSAARCATPLLGREVVDVDLAVADGEGDVARAVAREAGGHAFELSAEFGTWRAVAPGRGLARRRQPPPRRDDRGRTSRGATSP